MKLTLITNNLLVKISSILLATVLWFYVAGEERVETQFAVALDFNLADGMVISELSVSEIEILVRGRKDMVAGLKNIRCVLDLKNYTEPQTLILPIDSDNININPEVTILKIHPTKVKIKIDKLSEKVVPVRVATKGLPAQGYEIKGFVTDPVNIAVYGPQDYLKNLKYIETSTVDITGRRKSFRKMISLKSIPMIGKKATTQFVEVIIRIKPKAVSQ